MSDQRTGGWLAGLLLGAVSGFGLLTAPLMGVMFVVAAVLLIAINGPRLLAGAGLVTGIGLIGSVLLARAEISCSFPPQATDCEAGRVLWWIAAAVGLFVIGLIGSALALQRTRR
jgi:hypothetical protein